MPKVVTRRCPEQDSNPRPTDHKSNALPLHHRVTVTKKCRSIISTRLQSLGAVGQTIEIAYTKSSLYTLISPKLLGISQPNFNTKILQPFGSRMQSQDEIDRKETKQEGIDFSRFPGSTYAAFRKSVVCKKCRPIMSTRLQSLGAVGQTVVKL